MKHDLISSPVPGLPRLTDSERSQLRESIKKSGVLSALLVTDKGIIIDGEERYSIIKELGIKNFPQRILAKVTEEQRQEMAIRLNVERRHLTAQQRRELLAKYIEVNPEKSTRQIAQDLKVSQRTAANAKKSALSKNARLRVPTVGINGKTYQPRPVAVSVETTNHARMMSKLLNELPTGDLDGGVTPRKLKKAVFDAKRIEYGKGTLAPTPQDCRLILGDFAKKSPVIADNSVDLGFTDPPWGSEFNKKLPSLFSTYSRILKPGALLASYVGVAQLPFALEAARESGLEYWWTAVALNPGPMRAARKDQMVRSSWRPIVIWSKPGAKVRPAARWLTDVISVSPEPKKYHPWQQPLGESVEIYKGLARPGYLVADLCAGSGTSAVAAIDQGLRWIGFEIDPATHKIASKRIHEAWRLEGRKAG